MVVGVHVLHAACWPAAVRHARGAIHAEPSAGRRLRAPSAPIRRRGRLDQLPAPPTAAGANQTARHSPARLHDPQDCGGPSMHGELLSLCDKLPLVVSSLWFWGWSPLLLSVERMGLYNMFASLKE